MLALIALRASVGVMGRAKQVAAVRGRLSLPTPHPMGGSPPSCAQILQRVCEPPLARRLRRALCGAHGLSVCAGDAGVSWRRGHFPRPLQPSEGRLRSLCNCAFLMRRRRKMLLPFTSLSVFPQRSTGAWALDLTRAVAGIVGHCAGRDQLAAQRPRLAG